MSVETETGTLNPQAKECPETASEQSELRGRTWNKLSLTVLNIGLVASGAWDDVFCYLNHMVCGILPWKP